MINKIRVQMQRPMHLIRSRIIIIRQRWKVHLLPVEQVKVRLHSVRLCIGILRHVESSMNILCIVRRQDVMLLRRLADGIRLMLVII